MPIRFQPKHISLFVIAAIIATPAMAVPTHPAPAASTAKTATVTVDIKNFMFMPMTLTIPQGTTVVWTNSDQVPHTVVEKNRQFRSAALDTGDTFSHTFDTAGTVEYYCTLHPTMLAKIVVTPSAHPRNG